MEARVQLLSKPWYCFSSKNKAEELSENLAPVYQLYHLLQCAFQYPRWTWSQAHSVKQRRPQYPVLGKKRGNSVVTLKCFLLSLWTPEEKVVVTSSINKASILIQFLMTISKCNYAFILYKKLHFQHITTFLSPKSLNIPETEHLNLILGKYYWVTHWDPQLVST